MLIDVRQGLGREGEETKQKQRDMDKGSPECLTYERCSSIYIYAELICEWMNIYAYVYHELLNMQTGSVLLLQTGWQWQSIISERRNFHTYTIGWIILTNQQIAN